MLRARRYTEGILALTLVETLLFDGIGSDVNVQLLPDFE